MKDEREPKWAKQRKKRGFDDRELWSLDLTVAKFLLPRLKQFKINVDGICPGGLESEKWQNILGKMIIAFEIIEKADGTGVLDDQTDLVDEGLDLFKNYFFNLWY